MNLLMFVPLVTFILISVGLGAIPGALAKRKNRSRSIWWVAGTLGFPIALLSILCFKDLELVPDDQKNASIMKEKIVLVVILVLWAAMIINRIQMIK